MSIYTAITPDPKIKRWRSPGFLKFVSRQTSFLTGNMDYDPVNNEQRTIYHHYGHDGGTGIKCSDIYVIPVTNDEHRKIEDGIIIIDEMSAMICSLDLLNQYLVEKGIK